MSGFNTCKIKLKSVGFNLNHIPTALALIVALTAGIYAEVQNRSLHQQSRRAEVGDRLGLIRARLEGNVNANIHLVRGIVSAIVDEPEMDQQRFSRLAAHLLKARSQLRNIGAAPDLVVSLLHPIKGNERAVGLDYRTNAAQREAVFRARDTGELVLAGPVDLLQGGQGFIGRFPVFLPDAEGGRQFWGLVSAVIDVRQLYEDSGLADPDLPIDIALTGRDATGGGGRQFFGAAEIRAGDPVRQTVVLPSGNWEISAIPKGGWNTTPPNSWPLRAIWLAASLLVILPTFWTGRLLRERRDHIDEIQSSQEQLTRLSRRLRLALDSSKIGVWELNIDRNELFWDGRMKELYGLAPDDRPCRYEDWKAVLDPADREQAIREFEDILASEEPYHSQFRIRTSDGRIRTIRAIGAVHRDSNGEAHVLGVNWDASDDVEMQKRLETARWHAEARNDQLEAAKAQMEHNSLHDALTGLPNRRYLDRTLVDICRDAGRRGKPFSLLHIDLDRFKQINDTLGHAAGDAMLVHAAGVLLSKVRESDFVARIGGDEFVVVCLATGAEPDATCMAARIIEAMREPVPHEGHQCRFGVSVGVATADGPDPDPKRLLVNADIALYRAKSRGRNRYEIFTDELQAEIIRTKQTADDILVGLERDEFIPHFQPQFDAHTLELVGAEALVRWEHPTKGLLGPADFLKTAEELNVVGNLDRSIFKQVLWHRCRWEAAGIEVPRVAVNVSAGRLADEGLIRSISDLNIPPGAISFELLESTFLDENDGIVTENVRHLSELGIDIEIDDFGTGYASIVSLLAIRPRRLKIDRRLVIPIVETERLRQLVSSIVDIAKSLGIETVAEGVETMEHARILRDLGCDILQGHNFAAALTSAAFMDFARGRRWLKAG